MRELRRRLQRSRRAGYGVGARCLGLDALLAGRVRLATMIAFPVLWVQLGAVAPYAHFRASERDVTEDVIVAGGPTT
ncbi:MAG TPA: hypothetical protein VML75_22415 [Kofleriaceae bacterium]|nr:hypothetical protein [Kofleriaceae bacterium]